MDETEDKYLLQENFADNFSAGPITYENSHIDEYSDFLFELQHIIYLFNDEFIKYN